MIAELRGTVWSSRPPTLVLGVGGVGYELDLPVPAFVELPNGREGVRLHTHQVVREDGIALYGFLQAAERDLFRTLLKINGVGPRLALVLLSSLPPPELVACVEGEDLARLTKVPGIGKKTAERLLLELRGKLGAFAGDASGVGAPRLDDGSEEAQAALLALGYTAREADKMLAAVPGGAGLPSAEWIRQALRSVGQRR